MGIRTFYILTILLICASCDNTDYQVLEVDSKKGLLEVLSSNYIIDSVVFEKDDKLIYSMALKDKTKGHSKLNLLNTSNDYKVYIDDINLMDCSGANGIIFIREKGFSKQITDSVYRQKKHYQEIQQFWLNYKPCLDSIIKVNALRRLK